MSREEVNANFMSLTSTGPQEAEFYLGAADYELDRAVQMYYEQQPAAQQSAALQHRAVASPAQHTAPAAAQPAIRRRRQRQGFLHKLLSIPVAIINVGAQVIFSIYNLGVTLTTGIGSRVLPQSIQRNLQGIARSLTDGNRVEDANQSAASFKEMFQQQYAPDCPDFVESSWEEAAALAHRQFKFLLVYLHAAEHQDTDMFCQQTLCNPDFVHYVNSTLICWGGDVRRSNAFKLATSSGLRVTSYPYVALLSGSGSRTKMVASAEGMTSATDLLQMLQPAVEEHGAQFVADRADHDERELNRRLREEQDSEYQQSLLADQEREQKRAADREAEQAIQRAAQEAQDAERLEKETAERKKLDAATALQERKASKQRSLAPEPAAGTTGTATIRIRLPDGSSAQRRFMANQPLQVIYDFVDSLEGLTSLKYSLATTYPKVIYGAGKLQQSLSQLNLAPQAAMLVQPHDDD